MRPVYDSLCDEWTGLPHMSTGDGRNAKPFMRSDVTGYINDLTGLHLADPSTINLASQAQAPLRTSTTPSGVTSGDGDHGGGAPLRLLLVVVAHGGGARRLRVILAAVYGGCVRWRAKDIRPRNPPNHVHQFPSGFIAPCFLRLRCAVVL